MSKAIKKVLVSIPEPLLKRIDAKAKSEQRTRSAELCLRVDRSLKQESSKTRQARSVA